jgi:hypothetical protein
MLESLWYGLATRDSGECHGPRTTETIQTLAVYAQSSHGSRQLRGDSAKVSCARGSPPSPRIMQQVVTLWFAFGNGLSPVIFTRGIIV